MRSPGARRTLSDQGRAAVLSKLTVISRWALLSDILRPVEGTASTRTILYTAKRRTAPLQSIDDREKFDDTTKCILCAACTTSCPSFWANENFVGPAAIVNAHRFIFDSRDSAAGERLSILNDREGVWRCRTIFNCTDACPREIRITKAIGEVKKAILYGTARV